MPFYPSSHFENIEKAQNIATKVEAKKTLNKINQDAQEPQRTALNNKDVFKLIKQEHKHINAKPKQVSIKDIEREMKIHEMIEEKKNEEIAELLDDEETREIKNELIDVLAITHTHPDKNKLFRHKLSTSNTINKYVDDNVLFRFFNKANAHIKFGTLYGIKYMQTHREYAQYVKQMEYINSQNQPKAEPKEEPKEETE